MTHQQHPITPPPELVREWLREANNNEAMFPQVATLAAQWGADQELEACCEWVAVESIAVATELRAARRPKPPSLKEQALAAQQRMWNGSSTHEDWRLIRRALEQLDD